MRKREGGGGGAETDKEGGKDGEIDGEREREREREGRHFGISAISFTASYT